MAGFSFETYYLSFHMHGNLALFHRGIIHGFITIVPPYLVILIDYVKLHIIMLSFACIIYAAIMS